VAEAAEEAAALGGYRVPTFGICEDMAATRERGRKRAEGRPGEDPAGEPGKGDVIDSQKRFLNSKLNVFQMLSEVGKKSPERLEGFATVCVVRMLDALGREARVRARGKGAPPAAGGHGELAEPAAPPPGPTGIVGKTQKPARAGLSPWTAPKAPAARRQGVPEGSR